MPLLLRREDYLKKVVDMPSISLGLTPPLGEEPVLADHLPKRLIQAAHAKRKEQRKVAEKYVVMEETCGQVENVVGEGEREEPAMFRWEKDLWRIKVKEF
nr:hypothetical protein Iba_chr05aCG8320 [Ipomoea batatas]